MNMKKILLTMALSLFLVSSAWGAVRFIWKLQANSPQIFCEDGFTYSVEDQLTLPTNHDRGFLLFLDPVRDRLYAVTDGTGVGGAPPTDYRLALVQMSDMTLIGTTSFGDSNEFNVGGIEAGGIRESDGRLYIVLRHTDPGVGAGCAGANRCLNLHVFDGLTLTTDADFVGLFSGEIDAALYTTTGNFVYLVHSNGGNRELRRIGGDDFTLDLGYNEVIHSNAGGQTNIVESNGRFYFSRNDTDLLERMTIGGSGITTMDPLPDSANDISSFYHAEDASSTYIVVESNNNVSSTGVLVLVNEEAFTINRDFDFTPGQHQGKTFGDGVYDSNSITIHSFRNVAPAAGRRSIQRVLFTNPLTLAGFLLESDLSASRRSGNTKFSTLTNELYGLDLGAPAVVTKIGICT